MASTDVRDYYFVPLVQRQGAPMKMNTTSWLVSALLAASILPAHAALVAVDCSKKTLMSAITKLDKAVSNTVNITAACTEDVVISGFADLTLVGAEGAALMSASGGSGTTLLVNERSKVTVQALTIHGGPSQAVTCTGRSACVLRNATVTGGGNGIAAQDQSAIDVLGTSVIQNSQGNGISVLGASSVNVRPEPFEGTGPGSVISGHSFNECDTEVPPNCLDVGMGVLVQDGSFFRADGAIISGNGVGILAQRGAVIKVYGNASPGAGVLNNAREGIHARWGSTAGIGTLISGNAGAGIRVGALTHFHDQGVTFSGNNPDVTCPHVTGISQPSSWCGH